MDGSQQFGSTDRDKRADPRKGELERLMDEAIGAILRFDASPSRIRGVHGMEGRGAGRARGATGPGRARPHPDRCGRQAGSARGASRGHQAGDAR